MQDTVARPMLTLSQVAERLGISYASVLRLARSRKLAVIQLPGTRIYRVEESAVQEMLQQAKAR